MCVVTFISRETTIYANYSPPKTNRGKMWHEARRQEKKVREVMVNLQRRAERRKEHYEKLVSLLSLQPLPVLVNVEITCHHR